MSRVTSPVPVTVAPSNNMYTGLAAGTCVIVLLALVVLFVKAHQMGIELLKF